MKKTVPISNIVIFDKTNREILITFFIKGFSYLVNIYSIRVYNAYFENNVILGLWLTIISIINWIGFFDFGIGNGLRNNLTTAIALNDVRKIKESISSSYFIVSFISIFLLMIGIPLFYSINWNQFLSIDVSSISPNALVEVMLIVFTGTILHLFLKNIIFILYSMVKNIEAAIVNFFCNFLIIIILPIALLFNLSKSIKTLSLLFVLAFNFPLIIATIIIFTGKYQFAFPNIKYFCKKAIKKLFRLGNIFFFIQLALLVINSTNDILISHLFGNAYVVDYNAYIKIASAISGAFLAVTNPIWSHIAFYNAISENRKVLELIKKMFIIAIVACLGCILMSIFYGQIIGMFYGSTQVNTTTWHNFLMALYGCLLILQGAVSCIANGLNRLKVQLVIFMIGAFIKIPVTIVLINILSDWSIVIVVNIFIILLYVIIQLFSLWKYIIGVRNFKGETVLR